MRRRAERLLLLWGVVLGGCAEPTGTESGNPSQPGVQSPLPKLPPAAPPTPVLTVQPGPTNAPIDLPNNHPENSSGPSAVPASEASSLEPNSSSTAAPGMPEEHTAGPTVPNTGDGVGQTPAGTAGVSTIEEAGSVSNAVDAGDAGSVDAGP